MKLLVGAVAGALAVAQQPVHIYVDVSQTIATTPPTFGPAFGWEMWAMTGMLGDMNDTRFINAGAGMAGSIIRGERAAPVLQVNEDQRSEASLLVQHRLLLFPVCCSGRHHGGLGALHARHCIIVVVGNRRSRIRERDDDQPPPGRLLADGAPEPDVRRLRHAAGLLQVHWHEAAVRPQRAVRPQLQRHEAWMPLLPRLVRAQIGGCIAFCARLRLSHACGCLAGSNAAAAAACAGAARRCTGEWDTSNVRAFLQHLHDGGYYGGDSPLVRRPPQQHARACVRARPCRTRAPALALLLTCRLLHRAASLCTCSWASSWATS